MHFSLHFSWQKCRDKETKLSIKVQVKMFGQTRGGCAGQGGVALNLTEPGSLQGHLQSFCYLS